MHQHETFIQFYQVVIITIDKIKYKLKILYTIWIIIQ